MPNLTAKIGLGLVIAGGLMGQVPIVKKLLTVENRQDISFYDGAVFLLVNGFTLYTLGVWDKL